jgi:hypothetical protein
MGDYDGFDGMGAWDICQEIVASRRYRLRFQAEFFDD